MAVIPRTHVLIVCDEIEPTAGEEEAVNLMGVRARIRADGFPYVHPQLVVFLQMTGHEGMARCHLEIVQAETDQSVVVTPEEEVWFRGPLEIIPYWGRIEDCTFPAPGLYWAQVYFAGRLSGERLLTLDYGTAVTNGQGSA